MYRCVNAFQFGDQLYPGGTEVDDDDPILDSHGDHFVAVTVRPRLAPTVEAATAAPGEHRSLSTKSPAKKAPAKKAAPAKVTDASPATGADTTKTEEKSADA